MSNTLKLIAGLVLFVVVGSLLFKAVSIIITLIICAVAAYFIIQWAFPSLLESPKKKEDDRMLSPLERYKDKI